MAALPNVCLNLSSRAENVVLVRETLTGVAQALGIDDTDLNDISTAVTEACNNVVLHAYASAGQGPLEVEINVPAEAMDEEAMEVVVRDRGSGIRTRISTAHDGLAGIGLPVIRALARQVQFSSSEDTGTEVRMQFATPGSRPLESPPGGQLDPEELDPEELNPEGIEPEGIELPEVAQAELASTVRMAIAPTSLAQAVLPRVLCALAARAQFSTDRISDAQLVADALMAQAPQSIDGSHVAVGVSVAPRNMELHIGPLRTSRASWRLVDRTVAGLDPVMEKLTDHRDVVAVGCREALALQLSDRR